MATHVAALGMTSFAYVLARRLEVCPLDHLTVEVQRVAASQ
jgi:hypothetical protein